MRIKYNQIVYFYDNDAKEIVGGIVHGFKKEKSQTETKTYVSVISNFCTRYILKKDVFTNKKKLEKLYNEEIYHNRTLKKIEELRNQMNLLSDKFDRYFIHGTDSLVIPSDTYLSAYVDTYAQQDIAGFKELQDKVNELEEKLKKSNKSKSSRKAKKSK